MKRLWLVMLLLLALLLQGCQEEGKTPKEKTKTIILYSELEPKFSLALAEAYNKANRSKVLVQVITELQENAKPDIVLAEKRTLNGLLLDKRLKPMECKAGTMIPKKLQQPEHYWYGAFYDPTVFLVNQEYSRRVGQENLRGWESLLRYPEPRLVMENLSNTNSTQNFLGGFADAKGETDGLSLLWNLNPLVIKYANFPFSPIRMVAMGQADIALTRRSYVFKYLESSFPAYIVNPKEGSPVNLYCVGQFKESVQDKEVADLADWIVCSKEMQRVALTCETGYCFIMTEEALEVDRLWLNNTYLTSAKQESLTKRWLERVRFSSR